MKITTVAKVYAVFSTIKQSSAQGTTVYLPAPSCSQSQPALPTALERYYLSVQPDDGEIHTTTVQFVDEVGNIGPDAARALRGAVFDSRLVMLSAGQSNVLPRSELVYEYLSTLGQSNLERFQVSPNLEAISQTFTSSDGIVTWRNSQFEGGEARFCQQGSVLNVVFHGPLPSDCGSVLLKLLTSIPSTSTTTTLVPQTSTTSTIPARTCAALSTLEQNVPLCAGNTHNLQQLDVNSDGVCYGILCGTRVTGTVLTNSTSLQNSLRSCIAQCTQYNMNHPFGCKGVQYSVLTLKRDLANVRNKNRRRQLLGVVPPIVLPSNILPTNVIPTNILPTAVVSEILPSGIIPSEVLPPVSLPTDLIPSITIPPIALPTDIVPITLPSIALPTDLVPPIELPTIALPTIELPSITIPPIDLPTDLIPSIDLPSLPVPSIEIPSIELPSIDLPTIALPTIALPSIDLPSIELPSIGLPSIGLPSIGLPSIGLPSIGLPSIDLPSVGLPTISIPTISVDLPTISIPTILPLPTNEVPDVEINQCVLYSEISSTNAAPGTAGVQDAALLIYDGYPTLVAPQA